MAVTPILYARSLSGAPLALPAGLSFSVPSYSRAAIGGPKAAAIAVSGSPDALVQALNWLRCPLEIVDEQQRRVWWGFVNDVSLSIGAISIGAGLDALGNSVKVVYALAGGASAGTRATTTAATDADSISEYGTKEMVVSPGDYSLLQANQLRDLILAQRRYPVPTPALGGSNVEASGTLACRGWWSTLSWRYWFDSVRSEENHVTGYEAPGGGEECGKDGGDYRVGQSFKTPIGTGPFNIASIDWFGDSINYAGAWTAVVEIQTDSAGAPSGVVLASASYPIGVTEGLINMPFTPPPLIQENTTYWIVWRRSDNLVDGISGGGWFLIAGRDDLDYPRGGPPLRYGPGWHASPLFATGDLFFRLNGLIETTVQAQSMVTGMGQFLTGCDILDASGVYSSSYRSGDLTALAEIEALLKAGGVANVRILANVTPARRVQLYAEPAATTVANYLDAQAQLYDAGRNPIGPESCPAGVWVALLNVLPASAGLSRLAPLSPFFVEESTVDVRSGKWRPSPRGVSNVFKVGGLTP